MAEMANELNLPSEKTMPWYSTPTVLALPLQLYAVHMHNNNVIAY